MSFFAKLVSHEIKGIVIHNLRLPAASVSGNKEDLRPELVPWCYGAPFLSPQGPKEKPSSCGSPASMTRGCKIRRLD